MIAHLLAAALALTDPPAAAGQAAPDAPTPAANAAPQAEFRFMLPYEMEKLHLGSEQVLRAIATHLDEKFTKGIESTFVSSVTSSGALRWEWVARGNPRSIAMLANQMELWKQNLCRSLDVGRKRTQFDLDFTGGTLREYVAQIVAASGNPNISVDEPAAAFLLPPVRLQGVNLATVAEDVRQLPMKDARGARVFVEIAVTQQFDVGRMPGGAASQAGANPEAIYRIFARMPATTTKTPGVPLVYKYDPKAKDVAEQVDQLPQAVMMACAAEGLGPSDLTFNVHPSGLLMISGTKAALRVADAVISTALGVPRQTDKPAPASGASTQAP